MQAPLRIPKGCWLQPLIHMMHNVLCNIRTYIPIPYKHQYWPPIAGRLPKFCPVLLTCFKLIEGKWCKCVSKLTTTSSDNGLSPGRRQAIIWTNAGIMFIRPLGTNFSEILIEIHRSSFKKMHLKMDSAKWRPFCLGLNVLTLRYGYVAISIIMCGVELLLHSQTSMLQPSKVLPL